MSIKSALLHILFLLTNSFIVSNASSQTVLTPDEPIIKLDEIGIYSVGYQYRSKMPQAMPIGWTGMFEEQTGISCLVSGTQDDKSAFLIHCPWRNGTGTTYQEFAFKLPNVKNAYLTGFTAMLSDIIDKSDGAIFRIYINGKKEFEIFRNDAKWVPYRIDLNKHIGKIVKIKFETDPGANDNANYDYSYWGDRELHLDGLPKTGIKHSPVPLLDMSKMRAANNGSVVPIDGFNGTNTSKLSADQAIFKYEGRDGKLEYIWKKPTKLTDSVLGKIELRAKPAAGRTVKLIAGSAVNLQWTSECKLLRSKWQVNKDGSISHISTYLLNNKETDLTIKGRIQGKSLVFDIDCADGVISSLEAGRWGNAMRQKQVTVPYYSGKVFYLPKENMFVNTFLDWTSSSATTHGENKAVYTPLTDGSFNKLNETIIYTAAWHLAEVFPNVPNPKSPFKEAVGKRIVLDIWGGRFADIAKNLEKLHNFGITDCILIIHDWQRSGYDNALPMHIPANSAYGGDEEMKKLTATARRLGYLISLHENYVDYYTNYDFYNENDIALDSKGNKQLAWYNAGTKMQSYAIKPNSIMRLAGTQSPEINKRYGTNTCYLDVHSSAPPFFHIDQRAGEEGAGMFNQTYITHQKLFDYERTTHGGPVLGEGAWHWYWSGFLDGVEAQFISGWPGNEGMSAPLMVDFDLLQIHPLQSNHGMGYYERWWKANSFSANPPLAILDQYRMQEIAYGHTGFLSKSTWSDIPLAWLEHNLMTPVTSRYADADPVTIEYQSESKWVSSTEAAKIGCWDRVKITYDNGLTVYANNLNDPMRIDQHTLPQFGWLAEGAGVKAYTATIDGITADYAETDKYVFANARNASEWNSSGILQIRPELSDFKQTGARKFTFRYDWHVNDELNTNCVSFVHFSKLPSSTGGENIIFQQDHDLPKPTSQWKIGETVTDGSYDLQLGDDVADGDYDWYIGLIDAANSGRLPIQGKDDGQRRMHLATLHVRNNGNDITVTKEKSTGTEITDLYSKNLNTESIVLDFGTVKTNGSISVRKTNGRWILQTLPRERNFTILLNTDKFKIPDMITYDQSSQSIIPVKVDDNWWQLQMNGAKEYRWNAE